MKKFFVRANGLYLLLLGVVGLFVQGELFNFINVDIAIDCIRIAIAAIFLYMGYSSASTKSQFFVLWILFGVEAAVGIFAAVDNELAGVAPHGFTPYDVASHIVVGAIGIAITIYETGRKKVDGNSDFGGRGSVS